MVIKELKEKTERPKCDDCVSRADVLKYKCDCYDAQNHLLYAVPTGHIMRLPSVTPERKMGKWEEKAVSDEKVIDEWQSARCSACGKYHTAPYMYYFNNYNYCPNCGARMTEEDV